MNWLLVVHAARVSAKHLQGYWIDFHFRGLPCDSSRAHRFLVCLESVSLFQRNVSLVAAHIAGGG
jgi:hypothetical protein